MTPTYDLKIWCDPTIITDDIYNLYKDKIEKHNQIVNNWKSDPNISCDAGFDLFVPSDQNINRIAWANKVNMGVKTSVSFKGKDCSYYLYSRSSTPIKTPLRLANSVGIIDAGYRGHIIGLFDNIEQREYTIKKGDRLVQLCPPNITYPFKVSLINDKNSFSSSLRGEGGFGSTD